MMSMHAGSAARVLSIVKQHTHNVPLVPTTQDAADKDTQRVASHFATTTLGAVRAISRAPGAGERNLSDAWRPGNIMFLLHIFLECLKYPNLLLLSDDARMAEDALPMFAASSWLLDADPTLLCIAGASGLGGRRGAGDAGGEQLLLRTDVVPPRQAGLLFNRRAGTALIRSWLAGAAKGVPPTGAGWHRWLRAVAVSARQQCIVPEVPRVVSLDGAELNRSSTNASDSAYDHGGSRGADMALSDVDMSQLLAAGKEAASPGRLSNGIRLLDWMDVDHSWLLAPSYSAVFVKVCCAGHRVA